MLAGQILAVSSPQGRFAEGAARLDGRRCLAVEAYGKHLIYRFDTDEALHVHLGLFGRIRTSRRPEPEPRGAVRVRLTGKAHVVDINGPNTCEVVGQADLRSLLSRLGPDVLRPDADPDRAYRRIARSRAPIGRLIMDQSVMAGIGNIYRTEILWRQGVHPESAGRTVDRGTFDRIWIDAADLLALGVEKNAIITVSGARPSGNRYRERVNIFGKSRCPKCDGPVSRLELDGRRAYACTACQPREPAG